MTRSPNAVNDLRLWPGVAALAVQLVSWLVIPAFFPDALLFSLAIAGGATLVILAWWLLLSCLPWSDRLLGLGVVVIGYVLVRPFLHESLHTSAMGAHFYFYSVPLVCTLLVSWAAFGARASAVPRRALLTVAVVAGLAFFGLTRIDGIDGGGIPDFSWRWATSAEDRLLATGGVTTTVRAPAAVSEAQWPGYRGPFRDGVVRGTRIATDWESSPPTEIWRRAIGPGTSSFAIESDLFFTQEQRGDKEVVSAYELASGEPVWFFEDDVRFWDSHVGAGPRATPTLDGGTVFAVGATGRLHALDARNGDHLWSADVAATTGGDVLTWGVTGSPVVYGDVVVASTSGNIAAFDRATGDVVWKGPDGAGSYSSPHVAHFEGVPQVLMLRGGEAASFDLATGAQLWRHELEGAPILQPLLLDEELLIAEAESSATGVRLLRVSQAGESWSVEQRWHSTRFKPYFNDIVTLDGHVYGFDGAILASADLLDGSRNWKGGRYGRGQLLLLAEQGLLVVLAEKGDLALVRATPDRFEELGRVPAIEGKSWNHPAIAGDVLLVRNSEEMAAFRFAPGAT